MKKTSNVKWNFSRTALKNLQDFTSIFPRDFSRDLFEGFPKGISQGIRQGIRLAISVRILIMISQITSPDIRHGISQGSCPKGILQEIPRNWSIWLSRNFLRNSSSESSRSFLKEGIPQRKHFKECYEVFSNAFLERFSKEFPISGAKSQSINEGLLK